MKLWPESTMGFGKYSNKTLQWVIDNDPQYILWMQTEDLSRKVPKSVVDHCIQLVFDVDINKPLTWEKRPLTWSSLSGGTNGKHKVTYPYTFTTKKYKVGICDREIYLSAKDEKGFSWSIKKDQLPVNKTDSSDLVGKKLFFQGNYRGIVTRIDDTEDRASKVFYMPEKSNQELNFYLTDQISFESNNTSQVSFPYKVGDSFFHREYEEQTVSGIIENTHKVTVNTKSGLSLLYSENTKHLFTFKSNSNDLHSTSHPGSAGTGLKAYSSRGKGKPQYSQLNNSQERDFHYRARRRTRYA